MPTWPRPSKKTRSPGSSWSFETDTPMPYCAYDECGSETPTCANDHATSPEQSNPPGAEPAQTYGVPSCDIATPTTPPCVDGGATLAPSGDAAAAPTTTTCCSCACSRWSEERRACAACAIRSSRERCRASSCAIWPLID